MKIVLVIPTVSQGGAERVMSELANTWAKKGHDVNLVLLADGEEFYKLSDAVKIYRLAMPLNENILNRLISLFKMLLKLRNLIKEINPEFVLSFMNKYNAFTLISTIKLNQKIIVSERDSPTEKLHFITDKLRKYTYKFADGVICQTKLSKDFIRKETNNQNVISIPNPLKDIYINQLVKKENIIINVGRLVTKKGQNYLIESFSRLKNIDDWKLVLLGEGPLRNDLEKKIIELKLEDKVILKGKVKDVDQWLNKSSIFAFPSILEGFPNALAEAMAIGLPCVSFDCDTGPSDLIIDNKNGFLTKVYDIDNFTKRLQQLVDDKELRDSFSNEAKKISLNLNKNNISNLYLDFCTK